MLCEALLKMEQVTTALASLKTQAVPVTCMHGQLIFSTDVPAYCLLLPIIMCLHANGKWMNYLSSIRSTRVKYTRTFRPRRPSSAGLTDRRQVRSRLYTVGMTCGDGE